MNRPAAGQDIYIGLMSGTSLDGIDIAIVKFADQRPEVLHCGTTPYDSELQNRIREITQSPTITLDQLYTLDTDLGKRYADVVNKALETHALDRSKVAAVGCHGQTIRHMPDIASAFTAQIGDPNQITAQTGITTVADFRRKDMALGGQGAPLACAFHKALFQSTDEDRAVINIGGISNITLLPSNPDSAVTGFDTGPGNTLFNYWCNKHLGESYDANGDWAKSGTVIPALLTEMLDGEPYFEKSPPKSTGTEHFNPDWLRSYSIDQYAPQDVQATLVELSVQTIVKALQRQTIIPAACYVCGGGVHNRYLMERLTKVLPDANWHSTQGLGVDPDYVEAIAFAWLARERLHQRSGNLPEVTRAKSAAVLGGCYVAG